MNGDSLTFYGAKVLCRTIEDYWIKRGYRNVKADVFELEDFRGVFGVKSNLVAGMPPC